MSGWRESLRSRVGFGARFLRRAFFALISAAYARYR